MDCGNLNPRSANSKSWRNATREAKRNTFSQHTPWESVVPVQQHCPHSLWLPVKTKEAACGTTPKTRMKTKALSFLHKQRGDRHTSLLPI